jgi:hypothetical protein
MHAHDYFATCCLVDFFDFVVDSTMISLGRILPATWGVQETNANFTVRSKDEDADYIMAMRPAIVEHVWGNIVQQSLHGKLKAPT